MKKIISILFIASIGLLVSAGVVSAAVNYNEKLTIDFTTNHPGNGVETQDYYAGDVTINVSGTGQASGASDSDAFYVFTDSDGNPVDSSPANEFGLYIEGRSATNYSLPAYNESHDYSFTVSGNTARKLTFSIGDRYVSDNEGSLEVYITGDVVSLDPPQMVYPVDGQTLDLEGSYMFKVEPVSGARGYLFGFFQNGEMIYENWRDNRSLSNDGEFGVHLDNSYHNKFETGEVEVWIRAYISNTWSEARIITINLAPRSVEVAPTLEATLEPTAETTTREPDLIIRENSLKTYISDGTQKGWPTAGIPLAYLEIEDINKANTRLSSWAMYATTDNQTEVFAGSDVSDYVRGFTMNLRFIDIEVGDGPYLVTFTADLYNNVNESNENNNTFTTTVNFAKNSGTSTRRNTEASSNKNTIAATRLEANQSKKINNLILKLERTVSQLERKVVELEKKLAKNIDKALSNRLKGRILLQVEENGEAWYVDPSSENKLYMKDGQASYDIMRALGLGISNTDLEKIPVGIQEDLFNLEDADGDGIPDNLEIAIGTDPNSVDSDNDGIDDKTEALNGYRADKQERYNFSNSLVNRLKGRILLQVEKHGEAWYINPVDGKRYYLGDGDTAYNVMRFLSLGIKNTDLRKIQVGDFE